MIVVYILVSCQLPWEPFSQANTVQLPVETGRKLKANTVQQQPVEKGRKLNANRVQRPLRRVANQDCSAPGIWTSRTHVKS